MRWRKSHLGFRWRKDAICLHCFDRTSDGGRADIQVPESDFSHDFVVRHERDLAVIDARDSRLSVGHGDRERFIWPGSELDSRGHAAATLIEAKIVCVAVCPFANTTGVDSSWFDYSNSSNMEASSSLAP